MGEPYVRDNLGGLHIDSQPERMEQNWSGIGMMIPTNTMGENFS